jgi:hypothetical protein
VNEVITPTRKDISSEFERGVQGMIDRAVTRDELIAAREALIAGIIGEMADEHRRFLVALPDRA